MILATAGLDPSSLAALGTLVVAGAGAALAWLKRKPEIESIATRTTLEVNEALREELSENRREAARLRKQLTERDIELAELQRRFTLLRIDFDALETQLKTVRGAAATP